MNIDNRVVKTDSPKRFIKTLQRQLIRENPSALPTYGVDGELGEETTLWVERFQERKGLNIDGIAGPETLGRLRTDIIYILGDEGRGVKLLQEDLMYFTVDLAYGASGEFGAGTQQGVKDFQYFSLMEVDGVAGPETFKKIDEFYETLIIDQNEAGAHVRRIQKQLNEQDEVPVSINVDGGYGPGTIEAVRNFQVGVGLNVDGIVGPRTMNVLDREAIQPLTRQEMLDFIGEPYGGAEELSEEKELEYINFLEKNDVFQRTGPSSGSTLSEDAMAVMIPGSFSHGKGMIQVVGSYKNSVNSFVYSYINADEKNLISHFVFSANGINYSDEASVTAYDVEGNIIEEKKQLWVDFENDSVEKHKELAKLVREFNQESKTFSIRNTDGISKEDLINQVKCSLGTEALCIFIGALGVGTPASYALYGACSAAATLYVALHGCPSF
ncbi:MAG: peptidoglycan-binding protein [Anaerobacillus sp.]